MIGRRVQSRELAVGVAVVIGAAMVAAVTGFLGVMPASSQVPIVTAREASGVPRTDPFASFWDRVEPVEVALSAQNVTQPMGGGTVATLRVRAVHDDKSLYVLSEWDDSTQDAAVDTTTSFSDATAVEFPAVGVNRIPSFCMGDPTAGVNIWQWKSVWQNDIDHGFTTNRQRYPNMQVDYYPQEGDPTFQTGLAASNPLSARDHETSVENLVASQFGTLTHADVQDVGGVGRWRDGHWRVLFVRPLDARSGYPPFTVGKTTNAAFAVWNGSQGQRDGMKSVSQFVDLAISGEKVPGKISTFPYPAVLGVVGLIILLMAVIGNWVRSRP